MSDRSRMLELLSQPDGWQKAWSESVTLWDHGAPAPAFQGLIESNEFPQLNEGKALVPGCGSGWDVFLLSNTSGRDYVVGIDISPKAKEVAEKLREEKAIPAHKARFVTADFFQYTPECSFDVVYDHTFLCALQPTLRAQWATKVAELIRPGGHLVAYMYPLSNHEGGPPFALSVDIYRSLLSPHFEEVFIEEVLDTFESRTRQEYGEKLSLWKRKS
ncbi:uncharacterized protein SPPG_00197 [Spizellomyces punctatus DAOM BR117]|uniref:Thiopurine S-methyltransferase n=1 Tax=Spizellomyces punctatus (strain DAOM BR117) TaxID=645134 RepID=A0A0L0HU90_SPIPD|nr:uncharacterized protein SPPG_00197 [Spizellomyces punctatus DAOM BR117]KND04470.1 hypothetical protein SPPG_00197 [Spizellomyces punctatus DAOM BR117]|eukprot:XP_016612509.1 hypothetical protein SPPG_00197 [Spizellomyces punctatus DAOM BR117]